MSPIRLKGAKAKSKARNWNVPEAPPTPPPPPLPEEWAGPGDRLSDREASHNHVRKTIDATDWEATQAKVASSLYQVLVSGLPNQLLSDQMLDAILDTSELKEQVQGFKSVLGRPPLDTGRVLISLDNAYAAEWCARHFQGRNWGHAVVTAEVVSAPQYEEAGVENQPQTSQPLWQLPAKPLLPDAPEFVPSFLRKPESSASSWLEQATVEKKRGTHSSSGSSTRDDESESESAVDFAGIIHCP